MRHIGDCRRFDRTRAGNTWHVLPILAVQVSSIQNTLPRPTVLSTPMTPPIRFDQAFGQTTSPMPVPSSALGFLPEPVERLEQLRLLLRRQVLRPRPRRRCAGAPARSARSSTMTLPRGRLYLIALDSS